MLKLPKITGAGLMALTLTAGFAPALVGQAHAGQIVSMPVVKTAPLGGSINKLGPVDGSVSRLGPVDGSVSRVGPIDGSVNKVGPIDGSVNRLQPVDGIKIAPPIR